MPTEMSTSSPRRLRYTKLELLALNRALCLALMFRVLDKTPERCTCPSKEARGMDRVLEEAGEDGMMMANYSFQSTNHQRYDIPNNYFRDEDQLPQAAAQVHKVWLPVPRPDCPGIAYPHER